MRHDPAGASIVIMLRSLKLYGMANAVEDLVAQGAPAFEAATPMLSQLLKAEIAEREVRSIAYHTKVARFPAYKDLTGFDFASSEINEATVRQLHRCEFIEAAENVVLIGGPGTGKSHTATAIGVQAIEHHRRKVRFFSTVELVNALEQEKALGKAGKLAEMLTKVDLVILDELGYLPFSSSGGALLFHLLSKLYERTSVIITTNLIIADHIDTAATERRVLEMPDLRGDGEVQQAATDLLDRLREHDPDLLRTILASGTVAPQEIHLILDKAVVATGLGVAARDLAAGLCDIQAPLQLRRRGVEAKLVIGERRPAPDAILTQALREAHHWAQALKDGTPLKTIAADKNCTSGFIRKRGQLAFLSPRIQIAIRDGTLPPNITTDHILRQRIPLDWMMQERMFGV